MSLFSSQAEQQQLEDLKQRYVLRKIIYVNSAKHGYSEFEIDQHMALFGDNNEGKTASLAGLKLALFPEDSFTFCEKKFRFVGKDGNYSKEDSYRFYFPSTRSFIITEAENPDGVFCMLLYRSQAEWTYGRVFIPLPYEALRSLFWDNEALDGEGDFASDLEQRELHKSLKALGGVQVTESRQIAEYLYDGYRGDPEKSRFCLFPLNDGASIEAIQAFRNLYQIAFDVGQTDKKTLPRAIATIIEMQRGRKEERLSADLEAIQAEYQQLAEGKAQLDQVENQLPFWQQVEQSHAEYQQRRQEFARQLALFTGRLARQTHEAQEERETIQLELGRAANRFEQAKDHHDGLHRQYQQGQGRLKTLHSHLATTEADYQLALKVRDKHPGLSPVEINEVLLELVSERGARLAALQSEADLQARTQSCIQRKNQKMEARRELRARLENNEPGMLDRLSGDAAGAIYSLHQDFASVPSDVSEEVLQVVECFGASLENHEGIYSLAGTPLPRLHPQAYDRSALREQWRAHIAGLDADIQALEREIGENSKGLSDSARRDVLITEVKEELAAAERHATLILALDKLRDDYQRAVAEMDEANSQLEELKGQLNNAENIYTEARVEKGAVDTRKRELDPRIRNLQSWASRIARCDTAQAEVEPADGGDAQVTEGEVLGIEDALVALQRLRSDLADRVRKILAEGLIVGVDPFQPLDDDVLLHQRVSRLAMLFAELGHKRDLHSKAVAHHNTHVDNQLQELREAKSTLERFVRSLNDELNRHQVSNLRAIRLRLDLNPRFSQLMTEMERYDLHKDELIAPEFYQRMAGFCHDFFDGRRHRLKLEMIIAGIRYEYQRQGSDSFDTKSQSGGTTSTTTALILSILLKRISPQAASVGVPIIVDEIGTLDSRNTRTAIRTVAEHGFAIFCATPKPESTVMEGIGRWLAIDRFRVRRPQVPDCHACVLPSMVESFAARVDGPRGEPADELESG